MIAYGDFVLASAYRHLSKGRIGNDARVDNLAKQPVPGWGPDARGFIECELDLVAEADELFADAGYVIASIGRGMAGALKEGVEYNARMEQYTTPFTTMLGDQARAQQLVNDLKVEAGKTPFGMEDLASNMQTLLAFGMSLEDAQKHLHEIGDISQGDAVKMESLTLAFAQIS